MSSDLRNAIKTRRKAVCLYCSKAKAEAKLAKPEFNNNLIPLYDVWH